MSEAPKHAPLPEVLATARRIVNHNTSRGAIGVPVTHITGMAHALCALADVATSAAEYMATRERMFAAGAAGDPAAESAADDELEQIDADLTGSLLALGFLTIKPQETNDERAD